jgi:glycerol-3-phosphate O-acyltransferase
MRRYWSGCAAPGDAPSISFEARLDRYKLVERDIIREQLLHDPEILAAIKRHAEEYEEAESQVRIRVNQYIDEIVPFFNVLSYYRIGYNTARLLINLLYKSNIEYRDHEALDRIPKRDVVLYLMNHRSNADYVVVAYVLARVVSISYAVGEWARTWPLEYVFKSFGSYFIRRQFREPLYHTVLEHYVQLITRNGVTQGLFLEGGLTRDGALRPAKIGLLDYVVRTMRDPGFDRDIWLVPVGINYDRVLEDRSLIRERIVGGRRLSRWSQLTGVVSYLGSNLLRLITGRLQRYGKVAVSFGTPVSVRAWLANRTVRAPGAAEGRAPAAHAASGRPRHGAHRAGGADHAGAACRRDAAVVRQRQSGPTQRTLRADG